MRHGLLLLVALASACERRAPPSVEGPTATVAVPSASAVEPAPEPRPSASAPAPSTSVGVRVRPPPERPPAAPTALLAGLPRPAGAHAGFAGPVDPGKDKQWLERLASAPITEITRNPGGATITLRVRFGDGSRAVFKPEQKHSASNFRGEIAAYHLDRIVGFSRTAAVVGRAIGYPHLVEQLEASDADGKFVERLREEVPARDGRVAGAMIAWHAGRLVSAEPPKGWTDGLRSKEPPSEELAKRLPEWSDLVVFDFLIDNTDRWSGGNVLSLGGGPLIFLDNASSFAPWRASRGETTMARLSPICRFRRATVTALRALGPAAAPDARLGVRLSSTLAADPLAPVLSKGQIAGVDARVAQFLEHVTRCESELGEALTLSL
ncbi:MAG: hypothetical protein HYZ29_02880 [Myxococcales bacterium]|nr:hypothetical protein [Myxococcales bacterium]